MPLTNTQYDSIMRIYDDIRTTNRHIQADRYNEAVSACPSIADIDSDIIDMSVKNARARIDTGSSDTTTDELAAALKTLHEKRVSALASLVSLLIILMIYIPVLIAKIPGMLTEKDVHALTKKLLILYIRTLISRT